MNPDQFKGVIGRYYDESAPWWPQPVRAPESAPNVIVVLLDDVGFAQLGCFGSDIDTPTFDGLAANGVRYSNFHTTALCSPTRACVLTGRNHHTVGMGRINDLATGFPGYDCTISDRHGFLSETLGQAGWSSWAVGKWHLTPRDEQHAAASRKRWPVGKGFDRSYFFFGGETHQFAPALWNDSHQVDPPGTYESGYHLTADMTDQAISMLRDHRQADADKPFFLYYAPGACHSPHQAPREWIEKYRGHFDQGWDAWREQTLARQKELGMMPDQVEASPMPDQVLPWAELSDDQRRVYARFQEAFAGMLSHTDHEVGRLLAEVAAFGELDNTIVMILSDNGASSEGGPAGSINDVQKWNLVHTSPEEVLAAIDEIGGPNVHNNYPWGWTVAGNTPFRRWKRETHEGGVADPLIVHWPAGMTARGEVRDQYVHAIDLLPTILDCVGLDAPAHIDSVEQSPIEGVSFRHTFDDASAPSRRTTQYFEMLGCRGLYHDGWKAVVHHLIFFTEPHFTHDKWELYNVIDDPAEMHDLAEQHPDKLQELVERWWIEAAAHNVLPLDNRPFSDFVMDRPTTVADRDQYVYRPGAAMVDESIAANTKARDHQLTAYVDWTPGDEGCLIAQGANFGGYTFFVIHDVLTYVHNLAGWRQYRVQASLADVAAGPHTFQYDYAKGDRAAGIGRLLIDGEIVAQAEIPRTMHLRYSICGHGLTCGRDGVIAVVDDYVAPFTWTGRLDKVVVDLQGEPIVDPFGEAAIAAIAQ